MRIFAFSLNIVHCDPRDHPNALHYLVCEFSRGLDSLALARFRNLPVKIFRHFFGGIPQGLRQHFAEFVPYHNPNYFEVIASLHLWGIPMAQFLLLHLLKPNHAKTR